jgi:hypothetical protein
MMKVKILIVVLSLLAGFLCGYFPPRKIYVDMTNGWWLVGISDDGHKLLNRGNITIKTSEIFQGLRWADDGIMQGERK